MRHRSFRPLISLLITSTFAAAGCNLLLDIPSFTDQASTTAGTGGSGGAGGAGDTTSSASTGGGGAGGGTGGGPVCMPGESLACPYSGPAETEGVGLCKAGTKTCAMDGSGYGPCTDEILPAKENCQLTGDEDCDGKACGDAAWSRSFGAQAPQAITSAIVDTQGNTLIVGRFQGAISLGPNFKLLSNGGVGTNDFFVFKLDPSGSGLWARSFGDIEENGTSIHVTVDAQGNAILVGGFSNTVDFGGGPLTSVGPSDVFVAKLDADGKHLWSKRFGGADAQEATSVATDAQGNVVVAGWFREGINFDDATLTSLGDADAFLVKLDAASGAHLWSERFGDVPGHGPAAQRANAVSVDPSGNIALTGEFTASVNLGGSDLLGAQDTNAFVAKFEADGKHTWSIALGAPGVNDSGDQIAVDAAGNIVVTGSLGPTAVNIGGAILPAQGGQDVLVVKLGPAGSPLWSRRFGGVGDERCDGLALDAAGNVVLTGILGGTIDFGGGVLTSAGGGTNDVFLARLDGAGNHLWSRLYGDAADQRAGGVAIDPLSASVLVAVNFQGTVDFGKGPLTSVGDYDITVAKIQP